MTVLKIYWKHTVGVEFEEKQKTQISNPERCMNYSKKFKNKQNSKLNINYKAKSRTSKQRY